MTGNGITKPGAAARESAVCHRGDERVQTGVREKKKGGREGGRGGGGGESTATSLQVESSLE